MLNNSVDGSAKGNTIPFFFLKKLGLIVDVFLLSICTKMTLLQEKSKKKKILLQLEDFK